MPSNTEITPQKLARLIGTPEAPVGAGAAGISIAGAAGRAAGAGVTGRAAGCAGACAWAAVPLAPDAPPEQAASSRARSRQTGSVVVRMTPRA